MSIIKLINNIIQILYFLLVDDKSVYVKYKVYWFMDDIFIYVEMCG